MIPRPVNNLCQTLTNSGFVVAVVLTLTALTIFFVQSPTGNQIASYSNQCKFVYIVSLCFCMAHTLAHTLLLCCHSKNNKTPSKRKGIFLVCLQRSHVRSAALWMEMLVYHFGWK